MFLQAHGDIVARKGCHRLANDLRPLFYRKALTLSRVGLCKTQHAIKMFAPVHGRSALDSGAPPHRMSGEITRPRGAGINREWCAGRTRIPAPLSGDREGKFCEVRPGRAKSNAVGTPLSIRSAVSSASCVRMALLHARRTFARTAGLQKGPAWGQRLLLVRMADKGFEAENQIFRP
jgi:hypothetical protein